MLEEFRYNLKHNRKHAMKAATAWFLFGAIIFVFAMWGMTPQPMGGDAGGSVAQVNDEQVSLAQMSEMVDRMRRDPRFQQFQALGAEFGQKMLEQQALSQLIELSLIQQQTQAERIWTSDAEVRDAIIAIPAFQEDGRFKHELYRNYLAMVRKTPAEFENEIRTERSVNRTVELFRSALQPIPAEIEKQKVLRDMKANLEYLTIPTQSLVTKNQVSQADVDGFLADGANEAKIKAYFDSNKDLFSSKEQVRARHILVPNEGDEAKALAKANEIAARAKKEDFAKLAKEFSTDPGSKDKGGDLGFFERGQMVEEFDNVAFAAPVGEVSAPVKSQFGFHIIQVQEKKPAENRTLEQSRADIARTLIAEERSKSVVEQVEAALKNGDQAALSKLASQYGLKWAETGTFAVDADSIPRIGGNPEAIKTAFELSPTRPLAKSLVRQGAVAYALRYKAPAAENKKTETPEPSPEVMASFLAGRRGEDALRQWVEGLRKEAKVTTNSRFASSADIPGQ
ncbi:MAG TPA: SurA N-terminal domain-containing protein [Bdellovibrionales bacterium]|nr:SurA N-terminal domain-containing protein [Bdellovibrionales bacterium]